MATVDRSESGGGGNHPRETFVTHDALRVPNYKVIFARSARKFLRGVYYCSLLVMLGCVDNRYPLRPDSLCASFSLPLSFFLLFHS